MIKALLKKTNHSFKQGLIIQLKKKYIFYSTETILLFKKKSIFSPHKYIKIALIYKKKAQQKQNDKIINYYLHLH